MMLCWAGDVWDIMPIAGTCSASIGNRVGFIKRLSPYGGVYFSSNGKNAQYGNLHCNAKGAEAIGTNFKNSM